MKKLLLGAFFTSALIIAGTINVNAQTESATPVLKGKTLTKKAVTAEKKVVKKVVNKNATATPVSNAKTVPAKLKPIQKGTANTKATKNVKKLTATPIKSTTVKQVRGDKKK